MKKNCRSLSKFQTSSTSRAQLGLLAFFFLPQATRPYKHRPQFTCLAAHHRKFVKRANITELHTPNRTTTRYNHDAGTLKQSRSLSVIVLLTKSRSPTSLSAPSRSLRRRKSRIVQSLSGFVSELATPSSTHATSSKDTRKKDMFVDICADTMRSDDIGARPDSEYR
jgi:hypothetical protein